MSLGHSFGRISMAQPIGICHFGGSLGMSQFGITSHVPLKESVMTFVIAEISWVVPFEGSLWMA